MGNNRQLQFRIAPENDILTPEFFERVSKYVAENNLPFLIKPEKYRRTLFAKRIVNTKDYTFWLDDPEHDDCNPLGAMTWREFYQKDTGELPEIDMVRCLMTDGAYDYFSELEELADTEKHELAVKMLDEEVGDPDLADLAYREWGSPLAKAYKFLESLDLENTENLGERVGFITFSTSPSLSYYEPYVTVDNDIELSLLQARLNELRTGIEIETIEALY